MFEGLTLTIITVMLAALVQTLTDPRITRAFIRKTLVAIAVYAAHVAIGIALPFVLIKIGRGPHAVYGVLVAYLGWIGLGVLGLIRFVPRLREPPAILLHFGYADAVCLAAIAGGVAAATGLIYRVAAFVRHQRRNDREFLRKSPLALKFFPRGAREERGAGQAAPLRGFVNRVQQAPARGAAGKIGHHDAEGAGLSVNECDIARHDNSVIATWPGAQSRGQNTPAFPFRALCQVVCEGGRSSNHWVTSDTHLYIILPAGEYWTPGLRGA